jgi:integrase
MKPQEKGLRIRGGIWYVNLQVDGKRKEFRIGPDKQKAIAARAKLKLMALNGTLQEQVQEKTEQQPYLYKDAVKEHEEKHLKLKKSGGDSVGKLKASLSFFENRDVRTLRWQEFEDFRNQRLAVIAPSTVKQELDLIHAVLERQKKEGRLKENPLDKVERPKFNNVREEILSHGDFIKLLNVKWEVDNRGFITERSMGLHLKLALVIADYTAMRISEILNTKWRHIDSDYREIFIPDSKTKKKRSVPIHPELAKILASIPRTCEFVVQYKGKSAQSLKSSFNLARSKAKLPWVRIHDFRHRAITRWVQMSHPLSAIMKASGHSTFNAFSRYSNLKDGDTQILVGRKTEPLPYVTFADFVGAKIETKNVEKTWQAA